MHQIIYIGTARPGITEADVDAILTSSRANNAREGITGLLISDGTRFLQALEGQRNLVEMAYNRIRRDTRHRAAAILSSRDVDDRQFGSWDMAFGGFGRTNNEAGLREVVDCLVAEVRDLNTRALFSGFTRIARKSAA